MEGEMSNTLLLHGPVAMLKADMFLDVSGPRVKSTEGDSERGKGVGGGGQCLRGVMLEPGHPTVQLHAR